MFSVLRCLVGLGCISLTMLAFGWLGATFKAEMRDAAAFVLGTFGTVASLALLIVATASLGLLIAGLVTFRRPA